MTNLKRLMMELGNELVINYGADPHTDPRCKAIQNLMDELNKWGGFMEDSDESLRGGLELAEVAEKLDFKWPIALKNRPDSWRKWMKNNWTWLGVKTFFNRPKKTTTKI